MVGEPLDAVVADRREDRGHEARNADGIQNGIADLVGLSGNEPSPDGIALRPEILALVIKPLGVTVQDNAERHPVDAAGDAAVIFRGAGIDRHRMALVERTDRLHALIEQAFQHRAGVPRGAAHQKILRRLAPAFGKPVEIGLEAASGGNHLFRRHGFAADKPDTLAEPVNDQDIRNLGVIVKHHAQPFCMTA